LDLLAVAQEFGATLCVTGSVARHEEAEAGERPDRPNASDIDFYVEGFQTTGDHPVDVLRANDFVSRVRAILAPFDVDIYPLPGRLIDDKQLEGFRRDATSLNLFE
jgi:hypothetical protein